MGSALETRDLEHAVWVDGTLCFLLPNVVDWAKSWAKAYRDGLPFATWRPDRVEVVGFLGDEDDGTTRPVLKVVGVETAKERTNHGMGGLFFDEGQEWHDVDVREESVYVGFKEPLPAWVYNAVANGTTGEGAPF